MTIYGKTLEDYKRNDPDGAFGYWLDAMMVGLVVMCVSCPFVLVLCLKLL